MKTKLKFYLFIIFVLSITLANAQPTAFTYHGRLNDGATPVDGEFEMVFSVFPAASGGTAIAQFPSPTPITVKDGLFKARIDFGDMVFTGPARWMEIQFQRFGTTDWRIADGRIEFTSSPYAVRAREAAMLASGALTAGQLHVAGGAPSPGQVLGFNGTDFIWTSAGSGNGHLIHDDGFVRLISDTDFYQAYIGVPTGQPLNFFVGAEDPATMTLWDSGVEMRGPLGVRTSAGGGPGVYVKSDSLGGYVYAYNYSTSPGQPRPLLLNSLGGNVGIGLSNPQAKLHVAGTVAATAGIVIGNNPGTIDAPIYSDSAASSRVVLWNTATAGLMDLHCKIVHGTAGIKIGNNPGTIDAPIYSDSPLSSRVVLWNLATDGLMDLHCRQGDVSSLHIRGGADLAEPFPMKEEQIDKGSVVVIDDEHPGRLKLSTRAYDTQVAGVVSGANGINPGISLTQEGAFDHGQNVALTGRVYVKADASYGAIKPGDLLTTSDTPGHAMKVRDHANAQGAILGKAMSSLKEGTGLVLVLVTLQ